MSDAKIRRITKLMNELNADGDVKNTGLESAYTSNAYAASTFTSNNSLNTRLGGFVSNNFFQDNSGGVSAVGANTFTSGSGNYTVPAGVNIISGYVIGGGGGGGGYQGNAGGGSGGGSAPAVHFATTVTPGDVISYSVGAKGNRGSSGTNSSSDGNAGTASNLGTYATSNGGGAGRRKTSANAAASGGSKGTASGNKTTIVSDGRAGDSTGSTSDSGGYGGAPAQQMLGLTSLFKSDGTPISFGTIPGDAGEGGDGGHDHGGLSTNPQNGHDGVIVIVEFA